MGQEKSKAQFQEKSKTQVQDKVMATIIPSDFPLQDLPDDLLVEVFLRLSGTDLTKSCPRVCKHWHQLLQSNHVWKDKCIRDHNFPCDVVYALTNVAHADFKTMYFLNPYNRNLVKNPVASERFKHWKITRNGGNQFIIETTPVGCDPLSNFTSTVDTAGTAEPGAATKDGQHATGCACGPLPEDDKGEEGENSVGAQLDHPEATSRCLRQPHDDPEGARRGVLQELHQGVIPNVCRHGAQTHSPSAEVQHLVQRTSVIWSQVGDYSPLHGYRRQLPFSPVSLLRAPQHHLRVGEGDVPAICDEYSELVKNPTTADGWKEIADVYSRRWNFHHVLCALDGKHIRIKTPPDAGSTYYNYKGFNSIVLLALVDGDYKFRWVQLGGGKKKMLQKKEDKSEK